MATIYVYQNELLGDDGEDFAEALVDEFDGADRAACEAWFSENYDINDYTSSFSAPR